MRQPFPPQPKLFRRIVAFPALCVSLGLVGCSSPTTRAPGTEQPATTSPEPAKAPALPTAATNPTLATAAPQEGAAAAAQPGEPAATTTPARPESREPSRDTHKSGTPPKPTAKAPSTAPAASSAGALAPGPGAAAPQLDLTSLEQRLRDTRAIGVFTKLSLKNQVDDLLTVFRAYHAKRTTVALPELRQRYDLLLLKVLSLLQDGDPALAREISSSREAIWGILIDPQQFARFARL